MDAIFLTERRTRRVRLAPCEAAWLRANARGVVEVMPDEGRHVYRLTAAGYVGSLFTPRRRVEIASRIPAANMPWLLGVEGREAGEGWGPFDPIAAVMADRLAEVARTGLHHEYRERPRQGAYLVGRLDVPAQVRQARRDTLHGLPDDRTPQLPCNAVPAGLARRLLSAPLREDVRERLRGALVGWDGVASADGPLPDDAPAGYEPLFEACGWLRAGPGEGASSPLISLSRVFERHVARLVGGEAQRTFVVSEARGHQPALTMRPDVALMRGGRPAKAVDAKWKALRRAAVTDDVYQAVAYGAGLGVSEVVLVYPGRRRGWAFDVGPVRVRVVTLDVSGPRERCERAGRRLQRITSG